MGLSLLVALVALAPLANAAAEAAPRTGFPGEVRVPAARSLYVPPGRWAFGASESDQAAALSLCQRDLGGAERACGKELFTSEGPVRELFLPGFFLDRQEVTVGEYRRCVAAGRCDPRPLLLAEPRLRDARLPVTNVSWFDAERYCAFVGGRLPSELEWERAARGPLPRVFPWGDEARGDRSNHGKFLVVDATGAFPRPLVRVDETDGHALLAPPGSFPAGASPEGFVDLAGNASEWVADAIADDGPVRAPVPGGRVLSAARRMVRGGSFRQPLLYHRTTAWDAAPPELRSPEVGFRCASDRALDR